MRVPPESLIAPWLGRRIDACPCGRPHEISLKQVLVGRGVLERVGELAVAVEPSGPATLLADPDTFAAAGARTEAALQAAGYAVRRALTGLRPHADDRTVAALRRQVPAETGLLVAVGAGTINDLGKVLSAELSVPLVTVATAASMNGYASAIAALTVRGLKRTLPAPPAAGLVLDGEMLAAAPAAMTAAGYSDLMSKPAAAADWLLARTLLDEPICPTALQIADDAVARAQPLAPALGRRERPAVETLAEALVLSGLAMAVAGASSPASGGEHLVSHYLDISAEAWRRPPRLHGEQVAVGTLVSLALYGALRTAQPPPGPAPPDEDERALRRLHAHLDPETLDDLVAQALAKAARRPARAERLDRLQRGWEQVWSALDEQLAAAQGLRDHLREAGAPTRFSEIDVGPEQAAHLVRCARHMRDRYTVLDLAADCGRLDDLAGPIAEALR